MQKLKDKFRSEGHFDLRLAIQNAELTEVAPHSALQIPLQRHGWNVVSRAQTGLMWWISGKVLPQFMIKDTYGLSFSKWK